MSNQSNPKESTAYSDYELTATLIDPSSSLYLDKPVRTVNQEYSTLPEVQDLTWTDDFFDGDDDVIAVFDFDYESMEKFYTAVGFTTLACTILYTPLFVLSMVGLAPCYIQSNVRWNARAQHLAITRDGIRFVRDKRKSCWGMPCTDQGKSSKTVPFDKITDCDIEEPAGNTCIFVTNVLSKVNIDTASSGTEGRKELKIAGLKNPHEFKKLVWAMKRSQAVGSTFSPSRGAAPLIANHGGDGEDVVSLLRDIRDELRQNNDLLQKLKPESNVDVLASSPGPVIEDPVFVASSEGAAASHEEDKFV